MIGHLMKKNILVLLRNKHIFVILLLMPIVLISILGFALSDMMDGGNNSLKVKVFLVEHGSEDEEAERFISEVHQTSLPEEAKTAITEAVWNTLPIKILKERVFGTEELQENITFKTAEASELEKIKNSEDASAIIEVPENFTYQFLQKLFFNQGEKPELILLENEGKQLSSGVVEDILNIFKEQYALSSLLQKEQLPFNMVNQSNTTEGIVITKESVDERPIVSALTYYTFGMSTMFVFYVASSLSSMATLEKENHVFNRILLSNISPLSYLSSMALTGLIFAFGQICILFATMKLFYGLDMPNLYMLAAITFLLSFSIGGFTSLITAISFRSRNANSFIDIFQSIIVTVLAFIGGSFFPVNSLKNIGSYTPNGAGMQAYLLAAQEYGWDDISRHLLTMFIYGAVLLILAVFIFPRKERA